MPTINLTDKKLKSICTQNERVEFWDGALPGFGVRVTSKGAKTFCVMYRVGGKQRRFSLGSYPQISLVKAREMAKDAFEAVRKGKDPVQEKRVKEAEAIRVRFEAQTFERLARQYLEEFAKLNKRSWKEDERIINKLLTPEFGTLDVTEITRTHVRSFLRNIAISARVQANRTHACLRKIFNWAIAEEIVDLADNPASRINPPGGKERHKERILNDDEIRIVWQGLEAETSQVKDVLQLVLLTGQRPGEVMGARWEEMEFKEALWTIPGSRTKNGMANVVPLNPQALRILGKHKERLETKQQKREERGDIAAESPFVFPNHLLTRQAESSITHVRKATGRLWRSLHVQPFSAHDLRRTCATNLGQMQVPSHVIARILNHKQSDVTSAVYNQYQYMKEKREALTKWGLRVHQIVTGMKLANSQSE